MILKSSDLITSKANEAVTSVIHTPSRMMLEVLPGKNIALVSRLDSIGNVSNQTKFEGEGQFFPAVEFFEAEIAKIMGIEEVDKLEIGMIIRLDQDSKNFKAGQLLIVSEVKDGVATKVYPLNENTLKKMTVNSNVKPVVKIETNELLLKFDVNDVNDIESSKSYQTDLPEGFYQTSIKLYGKYQVGKSYSTKDGGEVTLFGIGFLTESGKSSIASSVIFEDTSKGVLKLKDLA